MNDCRWWEQQPAGSWYVADSPVRILRLRPGRRIELRIEDPLQLARPAAAETGAAGPNLMLCVVTEARHFEHFRAIKKDPQGVDFGMVVPPDLALRLWVFSREIRLVDANGQAVATAGLGAALPPGGVASPLKLALRVTGRQ